MSLTFFLLSLWLSSAPPKVEHPNLETWSVCKSPETDTEVERCGGLPWSLDLEVQ